MNNKPMGEPSSIKASITMPGAKDKKRGKLQRLLTLEMISQWIRLQGFDDYTTNGLIEMASKYPTQALPMFRKNFNLMIERVRAQRRAELQGQSTIQEDHAKQDSQAESCSECSAQSEIPRREAGGERTEGENPE